MRQDYSNLDDDKLKDLVVGELDLISRDALPILREELSKRRLNQLVEIVDYQAGVPSEEDLDRIVSWLRASPCPICARQGEPLNGCALETPHGSEFVNADALASSRSPQPSPALLEYVRRNQARLVIYMRGSHRE